MQVPVAFVLFDLDRFKDVNDTHGHEAGDAVLRDVAYEMRKALRSFELAYRVGGEELLADPPRHRRGRGDGARRARAPPDRRAAARAASASRSQRRRQRRVGDDVVYDQLFELADARLYEAKDGGRDRVIPVPVAHGAASLRLAG